jgi:ribonuclease D
VPNKAIIQKFALVGGKATATFTPMSSKRNAPARKQHEAHRKKVQEERIKEKAKAAHKLAGELKARNFFGTKKKDENTYVFDVERID